MFKSLTLSTGRLQSRRAALETEREQFERRMQESTSKLRADIADAKASRLQTIASLNAEIVDLTETEQGL